MYKLKFLASLYLTVLISCSPTPETFKADVVMFDKEIYSPTNPDKLDIYETRLSLPHKYFDIGTIKYQGKPDIKIIKELGAEKGADALIMDGNNFILIKFQEIKEKKTDENKTI